MRAFESVYAALPEYADGLIEAAITSVAKTAKKSLRLAEMVAAVRDECETRLHGMTAEVIAAAQDTAAIQKREGYWEAIEDEQEGARQDVLRIERMLSKATAERAIAFCNRMAERTARLEGPSTTPSRCSPRPAP